jgi:hypothetical protein
VGTSRSATQDGLRDRELLDAPEVGCVALEARIGSTPNSAWRWNSPSKQLHTTGMRVGRPPRRSPAAEFEVPRSMPVTAVMPYSEAEKGGGHTDIACTATSA